MQLPDHLLESLTLKGVLIDISVRYWRASKRLSPEDLGLKADQVNDRLISLGHKRLLPKESLRRFGLIESRAHGLIESNTFPFLHGLGHFLPNPKLESVMTEINKLEGEFKEVKEDFLTQYEDLRHSALADWRIAAQRLVEQPDKLVAAIDNSFPNAERLNSHFGFSVQLFQVRLADNLQSDLISWTDQMEIMSARQQAASESTRRMSCQLNEFVADCIASMREQTATLCEEMLASLNGGKSGVHQKTLNRLIRFIDQFKQLNFAGDRQMEEQLERVRSEFLVRSAEQYREDGNARQRLNQGLQGLAEFARRLANEDTSELVEKFGQMGQRRIFRAA